MDNQKLKIALIKQVVLPDLYVCETKARLEEVLFSSIMRVGPIGLFHEFDTDFFIVDVDEARECQIWKEINQTPINGPVELLLELKNKTINQIPGQEFKQPGCDITNGHFAVSVNTIEWGKYDIVISINISVPSIIVRSFPKILWCYMLMEPDLKLDQVYFRYDVSFNHNISGIPYYYPSVIDFPFTFLSPGQIENIVKTDLNRDSLKRGIFCDISCSKPQRQEKIIKEKPYHLLKLEQTGHELIIHNQNIRKNLFNLYDSKYFIKLGGSHIRGNSIIEAISAGVLVIGNPTELSLNVLLPTQCCVKSIEDAISLVNDLDRNNDKYKELLYTQRALLKFCGFDRPKESLLNILYYKRKYGPIKNNFKRRIIKVIKKLI